MKCYLFIVISIFIALVRSISIAGTIDPDTPDEKYLEFGKKFDYVTRVCGTYKENVQFCASGVAIKPKVVLTAAHVVKGCKTCYVILDENNKIRASKVLYHHDFSDSVFGKYDIAICILEKPFLLEFYPDLYSDKDEVGKSCTLSGFGLTGNFNTGAKISDINRRAGSNEIDKIDKGLLICTPSIKNKTQLEFLIASGDSGGGLFIGSKLAGIHSCVMTTGKVPDSRYGHESGHTRISDHIEWINSTLEKELK